MLKTARRRLLLAAASVVAAALVGTPAGAIRSPLLPPSAPVVGSTGIGDPYFPLDGNGGIDVLHYDVRVRYDFERPHLAGSTRLSLRATQPLRAFHLDLLLPVRSVSVDGRRARVERPSRHELRITPARPLVAGQEATVVVAYAGDPRRPTYLGERNWLADAREVVTMNQPHMAPWWFAANDHPRDKATLDIRVTVPRDRTVIGNGDRVGRTVRGRLATTHWRAREPMAPYLAFFAAGDFDVARGTSAGLPWVSAVSRQLPRRTRVAQMRLMNRTPAIVDWLEQHLGHYPFSSTGGVVTALPVGFSLETQTRPVYAAGAAGDTSLLVHELAHQWVGDSVALTRWRDIWLNEGLATWFEVRWAEHRGEESGSAWLRHAYDVRPELDPFWHLRLSDPGAARLFDEAIYQRGAMTAQALRERIGEDAFATVLRRWTTERRGGHGTDPQLRALAEQVSGQNLDGFFAAWLDTPTKPADTLANGLGPTSAPR